MHQKYLKTECKTCSPNGYCVDRLRSTVISSGGRLTKERLCLLQIICDIDGHFQPHHLLDLLREQGYNLSLTTVYRNLALLIKAGIISRASIAEDPGTGGTWYEHIWAHEHHDHLVCSNCGKRIEFSYPAIEILQEAVAKEYGFTLESHHLELIGLCPGCRQSSDIQGEP